MAFSLPALLTLGLLQLLLFSAWQVYRLAPARQRRIVPYRQPRKALLLLDPGGSAEGVIGLLAMHVKAARDAGLEVVVLESPTQRHSSGGDTEEARAMLLSGQVVDVPVFCVAARDGFVCEAFEAFLLAGQIDELYLAGGGAELDVHATARSAMARGYKVSVLLNAIRMANAEAVTGIEQALAYAAG